MKTEIETIGNRDLTSYDPEKGLKSIAVAEAAEKHFARATDKRQLNLAINEKLIAIRDFVLWAEKYGPKRGQPKKKGDSTVTFLSTDPNAPDWGDQLAAAKDQTETTVTLGYGKNGLPTKKQMERWRKRVKLPEDFAKALQDAWNRCGRIVEMEPLGTVRGTAGTGEFERYTPSQYIDAARATMGQIDLDPASNPMAQETVKAAEYFTAENSGLNKEWNGNVFLNPPYHRELQPLFIEKLIVEISAGRVTSAVVLTNNSTDTEWFFAAFKSCAAICFTNGRVKFYTPDKTEVAPTQGQAFFYFGNDVASFAAKFADIGFCMIPWSDAK